MADKQLDLSENSFLGALVIVASAVGSVVGVAALFVKDPTTIVGIAAGAAWALSLCLFVMLAMARRSIAALLGQADSHTATLKSHIEKIEKELWDARAQAQQWSVSAENVSLATLTVVRMLPAAPLPPARRTAASRNPHQKD